MSRNYLSITQEKVLLNLPKENSDECLNVCSKIKNIQVQSARNWPASESGDNLVKHLPIPPVNNVCLLRCLRMNRVFQGAQISKTSSEIGSKTENIPETETCDSGMGDFWKIDSVSKIDSKMRTQGEKTLGTPKGEKTAPKILPHHPITTVAKRNMKPYVAGVNALKPIAPKTEKLIYTNLKPSPKPLKKKLNYRKNKRLAVIKTPPPPPTLPPINNFKIYVEYKALERENGKNKPGFKDGAQRQKKKKDLQYRKPMNLHLNPASKKKAMLPKIETANALRLNSQKTQTPINTTEPLKDRLEDKKSSIIILECNKLTGEISCSKSTLSMLEYLKNLKNCLDSEEKKQPLTHPTENRTPNLSRESNINNQSCVFKHRQDVESNRVERKSTEAISQVTAQQYKLSKLSNKDALGAGSDYCKNSDFGTINSAYCTYYARSVLGAENSISIRKIESEVRLNRRKKAKIRMRFGGGRSKEKSSSVSTSSTTKTQQRRKSYIVDNSLEFTEDRSLPYTAQSIMKRFYMNDRSTRTPTFMSYTDPLPPLLLEDCDNKTPTAVRQYLNRLINSTGSDPENRTPNIAKDRCSSTTLCLQCEKEYDVPEETNDRPLARCVVTDRQSSPEKSLSSKPSCPASFTTFYSLASTSSDSRTSQTPDQLDNQSCSVYDDTLDFATQYMPSAEEDNIENNTFHSDAYSKYFRALSRTTSYATAIQSTSSVTNNNTIEPSFSENRPAFYDCKFEPPTAVIQPAEFMSNSPTPQFRLNDLPRLFGGVYQTTKINLEAIAQPLMYNIPPDSKPFEPAPSNLPLQSDIDEDIFNNESNYYNNLDLYGHAIIDSNITIDNGTEVEDDADPEESVVAREYNCKSKGFTESQSRIDGIKSSKEKATCLANSLRKLCEKFHMYVKSTSEEVAQKSYEVPKKVTPAAPIRKKVLRKKLNKNEPNAKQRMSSIRRSLYKLLQKLRHRKGTKLDVKKMKTRSRRKHRNVANSSISLNSTTTSQCSVLDGGKYSSTAELYKTKFFKDASLKSQKSKNQNDTGHYNFMYITDDEISKRNGQEHESYGHECHNSQMLRQVINQKLQAEPQKPTESSCMKHFVDLHGFQNQIMIPSLHNRRTECSNFINDFHKRYDYMEIRQSAGVEGVQFLKYEKGTGLVPTNPDWIKQCTIEEQSATKQAMTTKKSGFVLLLTDKNVKSIWEDT